MAEYDTMIFHGDLGELTDSSPTQLECILAVMIADNEMLAAVQAGKEAIDQPTSFGDGEIAEVPDVIVWSHMAVPVCHHRSVHRLDIREGAIAEADDVRVMEVLIGSEPDGHSTSFLEAMSFFFLQGASFSQSPAMIEP